MGGGVQWMSAAESNLLVDTSRNLIVNSSPTYIRARAPLTSLLYSLIFKPPTTVAEYDLK